MQYIIIMSLKNISRAGCAAYHFSSTSFKVSNFWTLFRLLFKVSNFWTLFRLLFTKQVSNFHIVFLCNKIKYIEKATS